MQQITLMNPRRLVFGEHSIDLFAADYLQAGLKKLYLITVPAVLNALEKILEKLQAGGVEIRIHDTLAGEPSLRDFESVLADARQFGADSVAGIGGGSVLDMAKLVAAQLYNPPVHRGSAWHRHAQGTDHLPGMHSYDFGDRQ